MINVSTFLGVRALAEDGLAKKEIARGLGTAVRTVRKYLGRTARGEKEPRKQAGPGELEPFHPKIRELAEAGFSIPQIYQELQRESGFEASYPTVRRCVRSIRPREEAASAGVRPSTAGYGAVPGAAGEGANRRIDAVFSHR